MHGNQNVSVFLLKKTRSGLKVSQAGYRSHPSLMIGVHGSFDGWKSLGTLTAHYKYSRYNVTFINIRIYKGFQGLKWLIYVKYLVLCQCETKAFGILTLHKTNYWKRWKESVG